MNEYVNGLMLLDIDKQPSYHTISLTELTTVLLVTVTVVAALAVAFILAKNNSKSA